MGRDLLIRTASLRLCLVVATAVAARISVVALAGYQVAFEVWTFLALALDALAIAGQSLVGTALGATRPGQATATARKILWWCLWFGLGTGLLLLAVRRPLAGLFTDDPAVQDVVARLLVWVALLQPIAAVAFGLDGILIGAGDLRFLARAMAIMAAGFVVVAGAVAVTDAGVDWLWAALALMMLGRLVPLLVRFRRGRWAVVGADHPRP
jgi:putative MATE family efflux protein